MKNMEAEEAFDFSEALPTQHSDTEKEENETEAKDDSCMEFDMSGETRSSESEEQSPEESQQAKDEILLEGQLEVGESSKTDEESSDSLLNCDYSCSVCKKEKLTANFCCVKCEKTVVCFLCYSKSSFSDKVFCIHCEEELGVKEDFIYDKDVQKEIDKTFFLPCLGCGNDISFFSMRTHLKHCKDVAEKRGIEKEILSQISCIQKKRAGILKESNKIKREADKLIERTMHKTGKLMLLDEAIKHIQLRNRLIREAREEEIRKQSANTYEEEFVKLEQSMSNNAMDVQNDERELWKNSGKKRKRERRKRKRIKKPRKIFSIDFGNGNRLNKSGEFVGNPDVCKKNIIYTIDGKKIGDTDSVLTKRPRTSKGKGEMSDIEYTKFYNTHVRKMNKVM